MAVELTARKSAVLWRMDKVDGQNLKYIYIYIEERKNSGM